MKIRNDSEQIAVPDTSDVSDVAKWVWLTILTLAGIGGSLVISCVAPFVALAVALAGTVRLKFALWAIMIVWFANQLIGFSFFNFPRTANTFLWGLAIGGAAVLASAIASLAMQRLQKFSNLARMPLAFGFAFAAYQGTLMGASLILGGRETFIPEVIAKVFVTNAAWLVGLICLNELMSILARPFIGRIPRLLKA